MIPVDGSSQYGTSQLYGFSIWAEDSNTHIYSALQAYQKINDLTVTDMNMDLNPYMALNWIISNGQNLVKKTCIQELCLTITV